MGSGRRMQGLAAVGSSIARADDIILPPEFLSGSYSWDLHGD